MNTIIVYVSMSGSTEFMAHTIENELIKAGEQVVVKEAMDVKTSELLSYERIIIGSYTWGDGELPYEMLDFSEELESVDLTGKMAAVFGSGESHYEHFARAVDILDETLVRQGSTLITKGLKAEAWMEEETEIQCREFSRKLIEKAYEKAAL